MNIIKAKIILNHAALEYESVRATIQITRNINEIILPVKLFSLFIVNPAKTGSIIARIAPYDV